MASKIDYAQVEGNIESIAMDLMLLLSSGGTLNVTVNDGWATTTGATVGYRYRFYNGTVGTPQIPDANSIKNDIITYLTNGNYITEFARGKQIKACSLIYLCQQICSFILERIRYNFVPSGSMTTPNGSKTNSQQNAAVYDDHTALRYNTTFNPTRTTSSANLITEEDVETVMEYLFKNTYIDNEFSGTNYETKGNSINKLKMSASITSSSSSSSSSCSSSCSSSSSSSSNSCSSSSLFIAYFNIP